MNPKHMFIYSGMVYRIRPHGLQILTPSYFQHFKKVRNTAWFITVPKSMIEGWVKRGVVAQLLPFEKGFKPLTWRPTYYDGQIPPVNTKTRRRANFSKRDSGYVPWWAHNGLQLNDNDWDLKISYYSNQLDIVVHYAPPLNQTSVQLALSQHMSLVSTNVQASTTTMQQSSMVTSSIATSTSAPVFHSGLVTATTSSQSYTGTGRPTYSRISTSDGQVRRSK
jgi:hypothetical protein